MGMTESLVILAQTRILPDYHATFEDLRYTPYQSHAVNFINVLRTNFSYEGHFGSLHVTRENDVRMKNARV